MDQIKEKEYSFTTSLTLLLVILTVLICIFILAVITHNIIRPINKLSDTAIDYIGNNKKKKTFASLDIHRSDEIGNLSEAMKKMESDIHDYVDNIRSMTAEKERVAAELNVAAKLQSDLLPKTLPKRDDIQVYATMTPAKEMGGDFYDFFMIDDDHIGLVMADVSGKGVSAAMFMIAARTLIKLRAYVPGKPSEMLRDVNNTLCGDNPFDLFVTTWLGILDLSTGELISANAGHEYPAFMRENGSYVLIENDHSPPLAAMEDMDYEDIVNQLQPGDRLFLYTDGVPEAKAPDGSRFGTDKLLSVLNNNRHCTPEELLAEMKRRVDEFTGSNDPFDDVTMMNVIWKGN